MWTRSSIRLAIARGRHGLLGAAWGVLSRISILLAAAIVRARDRSVSVYLRGSTAHGDSLAGLSDLDLVAIAPEGSYERTRRAWKAVCRRVPLHRLVWVAVWRAADREPAPRHTAYTYRAPTDGHAPSSAMAPALIRPDLYGAGTGWKLVSGRDVRPHAVTWDEGERGIVAWGELQLWWRFVFRTAFGERAVDHLDYPWLKVIAEHARVLLWLDHSIVLRSRPAVLATAVQLYPGDEVLRRAWRDWDTGYSPRSLDVPEILAWALAAVKTVADKLGENPDGPATSVKLEGEDSSEQVLPMPASDEQVLPLADWHARVLVRPFEEGLVATPGEPTDLGVLARCARDADKSLHRAIEYEGLLIAPVAEYGRAIYRSIQCPVSDPVSFALLRGESAATFPGKRGWSAADCAQRAVDEHTLWLSSSPAPAPSLRTLGRLLNAVRAASFASSVMSSNATLPLNRMAAAENPPEGVSSIEEAVGAYAAGVREGTAVPHDLVVKLRGEVLRLPAFAEPGHRP